MCKDKQARVRTDIHHITLKLSLSLFRTHEGTYTQINSFTHARTHRHTRTPCRALQQALKHRVGLDHHYQEKPIWNTNEIDGQRSNGPNDMSLNYPHRQSWIADFMGKGCGVLDKKREVLEMHRIQYLLPTHTPSRIFSQ